MDLIILGNNFRLMLHKMFKTLSQKHRQTLILVSVDMCLLNQFLILLLLVDIVRLNLGNLFFIILDPRLQVTHQVRLLPACLIASQTILSMFLLCFSILKDCSSIFLFGVFYLLLQAADLRLVVLNYFLAERRFYCKVFLLLFVNEEFLFQILYVLDCFHI